MARQPISAAVILIVMMLAAVVIYLIIIPVPISSSLIFGNSPGSANATNNAVFTHNFDTYVGGNPSASTSTYSLGTFSVSAKNITSLLAYTNSQKLTSWLFGTASSNIQFPGDSADSYAVEINVSTVSGTPFLSLSLNGNNFYKAIPTAGEEITVDLPKAQNGNNTLSITNNLNGWAFAQSIGFANVSVTHTALKNSSESTSTSVPTIFGLGQLVVQYLPIGQGTLFTNINGTNIGHTQVGNDTEVNMTIPPSLLSELIPNSSSTTVSVPLKVGFSASAGGNFVVTGASILYVLPSVPEKAITTPYTISATTGNYVVILYVNSVIKQGNISFSVYPSGALFSIPAAKLTLGENVVVLPSASLASQPSKGTYSGTITVSSSGLFVPTYLSIKATS